MCFREENDKIWKFHGFSVILYFPRNSEMVVLAFPILKALRCQKVLNISEPDVKSHTGEEINGLNEFFFPKLNSSL